MKKAAFITLFILSAFATLVAQDEYRISQSIPDSIDRLYINEGWQVRILQGEQPTLTIITPCSYFFEEDNEPQISAVTGRVLTLNSNKNMPRTTVVEITLKQNLSFLIIEKNATVQTEDLVFNSKFSEVTIYDGATLTSKSWISAGDMDVYLYEGATATGKSWKSSGDLDVSVYGRSNLRIDTLQAKEKLTLRRKPHSQVYCPTLISADTKVMCDVKSIGTLYQTDSTRNLTVKNVNREWLKYFTHLTMSIGISSPIPLYMNNKSGSPYNRGENYRLSIYYGIVSPIPITERITFKNWFIFECDWGRLLNNVNYNGNALTLNTPTSGQIPQQHLNSENLGLRLLISYTFGKKNPQTESSPYHINLGVDVLRNCREKLITRTMGNNNHWSIRREETNVMNPWQLRASLSIGGGPLTKMSIGLTYDLLPTFRSSAYSEKIHTFGVTLQF